MFASVASPFGPHNRLGSAMYVRSTRATAGPAGASKGDGADLGTLTSLVLRLQRASESVSGAATTRRTAAGSTLGPALARSANALQISTQLSAAEMVSTGEINGIPTSYRLNQPGFAGSSTSTPVVGGIYNGDQGDDTLTFQVVTGGIVGVTPTQIEVRDGANDVVDTIDFGPGYTGEDVTIANGLTLSLGAGTTVGSDQFEVDVFASVGSVVNTANPFNGTGNSNPNFEPGVTVRAGNFEINGVQIAVVATDSVNSVLTKINSSAAGVTASFDSATERLVLTQNTAGSEASIVLGADNSGFLAATKLDLATVQEGTDDERALALRNVAAFSGISSGSFSVNGLNLTVDVLNDSLNDIIDRINNAGAGAIASFDTSSNRFSIVSESPTSLTLSDGSSGLFSGLGVQPGTVQAVESSVQSGVEFRDGRKLRRRLDDFGEALKDLLETKFDRTAAPAAAAVKMSLRAAFVEAFDVDEYSTSFSAAGLTFRFDGKDGPAYERSVSALRRAVEQDPQTVLNLFDRKTYGLLPQLKSAFGELDEELARFASRSSGSLIDVRA